MKAKLIFSLFLFLASMASSDLNTLLASSKPFSSKGQIGAKLEGTEWGLTKITLAIWTSNQLHIKGETDDGALIQLSIMEITGPGEYNVGAYNLNIATIKNSKGEQWSSGVLTVAGIIEVTHLSTTGAKGKFHFTGTDGSKEKQITEGYFNVEF